MKFLSIFLLFSLCIFSFQNCGQHANDYTSSSLTSSGFANLASSTENSSDIAIMAESAALANDYYLSPEKETDLADEALAASDSSPASLPTFKDDGGTFKEKHESCLRRAQKKMGLLFLGDSITEGWERREINGAITFKKEFSQYDAANFGISGDKTQHLIWRLVNGELDYKKPQAIVLMIGTNNTSSDKPSEIVEGIRTILKVIREKSPESKILLLGIYPRTKSGSRMDVIRAVNAELAKFPTNKKFKYIDVSKAIKNFDLKKFGKMYLYDGLHLNPQGYKKIAEIIRPTVTEFMKGY